MELINNLQNELESIKAVMEKYNKVKETRKRNMKKYIDKNRDKINEYNNKYITNKYHTDPEFREKAKRANKEYRERQKMKKHIIEMQNEPALQEFGELDIIIQ
jgi:pyruvate/2-oxoacid:ferredoxin oxidoreductase beta subunit